MSLTRYRRKQGRLSGFPSLPLDVMNEIFVRLDPASLLSLARTTKAFRQMLMSRSVAFIWREVLAASVEEGYPPCPKSMPEPAWAQLVFGGFVCSACGIKTAQKILWEFNRRVCKACKEKCFVVEDDVSRIEGMVSLRDILPTMWLHGHTPSFWKEDVDQYTARLKEIQESGGPDAQSRIIELHASMSQDLELLQERNGRCLQITRARERKRAAETKRQRTVRFEDIRRRLLALGYLASDLDSPEFRGNKTVKAPGLVTDKAWIRLEPIVRKVADEVRQGRVSARRQAREKALQQEYGKLRIDLTVWFKPVLPHSFKTVNLPFLDIVLAQDVDVSSEFRQFVRDTLSQNIGRISPIVQHHLELYQRDLPFDWPRYGRLQSLCKGDNLNDETALATALLRLDLAAYTFRCSSLTSDTCSGTDTGLHFGMEGLSHFCVGFEARPDWRGHATVFRILGILGLDPSTTAPIELDRLDRRFVLSASRKRTVGAFGRLWHCMTWREVVAEVSTGTCTLGSELDIPDIRLATEEEEAVEARARRCDFEFNLNGKEHNSVVWVCRQSVETDSPCRDHGWTTLSGMRAHIQSMHEPGEPIEGRDFLFVKPYDPCDKNANNL